MNKDRTLVKRKFFVNYLKEENWLNHMSSMGYHLVSYTPFTYVFKEGEPGAYTYYLELLDDHPSTIESQNYISFLKDMNVEVVGTHWRWLFIKLNKDTNTKELFTDLTSKLKHHKKVMQLYTVILLLLGFNLFNLPNLLLSYGELDFFKVLLYPLTILNFIFFFSIGRLLFHHYKVLNRYEKEQQIYDK